MIIETGSLVFISLIVMVWRLPRKAMLWLFGHPLWLELPFSVAAYALHYGTFSGMMAAATAGCMCFCFVQAGLLLVGHIAGGAYSPVYVALTLDRTTP